MVRVELLVGVCVAERRRAAAAFDGAQITRIDETVQPHRIPEFVRRMVEGASAHGGRLLVECPSGTNVSDLLTRFGEPDAPGDLEAVIAVVDAVHLLADLGRSDRLAIGGESPHETPWAAIAAHQIEHASVVLFANWRGVAYPRLLELVALVGHLNPDARLRFAGSGWLGRGITDRRGPSPLAVQPGWVQVLNGEFAPHVTAARIGAVRYEQLRPFHPERLATTLESRFERQEVGRIVRSAGLCRLATRPGITGSWDQVGPVVSFDPLAVDGVPDDAASDDEDVRLALGQEIAFIGFDLDAVAIRERLDACVLTDDEFAEGPSAWLRYPDPLPSWRGALR